MFESTIDVEAAVRERYSAGAQTTEAALCCAVTYDPKLLEAIPQEVIDRDYSDIVCDEDVPEELQRDPELWSGCISGAYREDRFLSAFEQAGFYGIEIIERQAEPWQTVAGMEFRSLSVVAYKGKVGASRDQKHAVVYKGPFKQVQDDDGHVLARGVRVAVCEKTFDIFSRAPYRTHVELIAPRETRGADYDATTKPAARACEPPPTNGSGCC